ncbi:FHA domain-containing protein [Vibrio sp. SCSIO 43136]|uniref:FHA domain-containing protein n=1 Tax=Vibrio sp. SCSIO 43136 TaxID=2819101 RepID=UPI002075C13E|nr:FHA domain-containing protein [Vibrio sp. SCSIO 43136]USD66350.1 FHA domain-containing protein [Vibrio sp. SCSIO 43136]
MSISFQLIELPDNEQVNSRQVSLPAQGGTIGRSFECAIQLPDFARSLSRVHAEVLPHPVSGFQVVDRSTNGVFVNDQLVGRGESRQIADGDRIRMGAYTLLVSDMSAMFAPKEAPIAEPETAAQQDESSPFKMDSVMESASDFELEKAPEPTQTKEPKFNSDNVTGEDLYGYDPFDDDNDWDMVENLEPEEVVLDSVGVEANKGLTVSHGGQSEELATSIRQLNAIIEQQQHHLTASIDKERLTECIEATLEKFLDTLNPDNLEDEFDDYITGWGNKEKKYWSLYKKQFNRKQERREFYHQFSALLFEQLREKR